MLDVEQAAVGSVETDQLLRHGVDGVFVKLDTIRSFWKPLTANVELLKTRAMLQTDHPRNGISGKRQTSQTGQSTQTLHAGDVVVLEIELEQIL